MTRGPVVRATEFVARALILGLFDYRAEGSRNVPLAGGVIVACTHQSHLDPIMARAPLDRPMGFVARKTLFANPAFAGIIRGLGAIELDRDATTAAGLRQFVDLLRAGTGVILFPEGTRSRDGEIGPLRPGVALLASRSGVPVVPAAVHGTWECWPRDRKFPRPGRIRVVYGEPETVGKDVDRGAVLDGLGERLRALRDRAREMA